MPASVLRDRTTHPVRRQVLFIRTSDSEASYTYDLLQYFHTYQKAKLRQFYPQECELFARSRRRLPVS